MSISTSPVQPGNWLQQLPGTVRTALDANADGKIDTREITDFLGQLLDAVKGSPASYDAGTGSPIITKPTVPGVEPKNPLEPSSSTSTAGEEAPAAARTWRDFVFGRSSANNYAGVMAQPTRDVPTGYTAGRYRSQLEGFNDAKFDPAHPEGMTLKMIAGRVFEQFDVYSPTAIDDVVAAFNELGIPAQKVGIDTIDFGNGEGPIDVIRNAAYLDGDKAAGMGWQWAPVNDGTTPLNFTMGASLPPTLAASAASGITGTPSVFKSPYAQPSGSGDQLSASEVKWLHADVGSWPVTSTITDVGVGKSSVTIEHTKAGQWPVYDLQGAAVEGNPWILVNRNGQWLAATYDWLRPGQTEKSVTANDIGENARDDRLEPRPGELVGLMVSTIARNGDRTSNERSNIVLTTWPA
jgi:hypothetical protein